MMRRPLLSIFKLFCLLLLTVLMFSCSKPASDDGPPSIQFLTTSGNTYKDATVKKGESFITGIEMLKSGNDLLHYLNVYCSYDGKPDSLILQIMLSGTQSTSYTNSFYFNVGNSFGSEKYTFEANSYLGQRSSIGFTVSTP